MFILIFSIVLVFSGSVAATDNSTLTSQQQTQMMNTQIPFIENSGQNDPSVTYYADTFYGTAFVTNISIVHSIQGENNTNLVVKEEFLDENGEVIIFQPQGEEPGLTQVNYFLGNDSTTWQTNLTTWNIINLGELYPGINVLLRANGGNVEKIFQVAPGANVNNIKIQITGTDGLSIDEEGNLILESSAGNVQLSKPVAYQEEQNIDATYNLNGNKYGFQVGPYNTRKTLTIDPTLQYSTYMGGTGAEYATGMAVDDCGNIYITGYTTSTDFPTSTGAYQSTNKGSSDAFVSKFNNNLSTLLASTYIGGSTSAEFATGMVVDDSGNIYITGYTYSTDFPTSTVAYQSSNKGYYDVFVSKFNNNLSSLLASTYIGGTNEEWGYGIDLDDSGNIYITGHTRGSNFPITSGAYQTTFHGSYDVFVSKLNNNLSILLASTYIGGNNFDWGFGIDLDDSGNIYITGYTLSTNFPVTTGAYQTTFKGGYDGFVSKLNNILSSLLESTYIGGNSNEYLRGIDLDDSGNIYITGYTYSTDFPITSGAYQTSNAGGVDIIASKLNNNLSSLLASTYIGGTSDDYATAIAGDDSGNIYITGNTVSTNYPTTEDAHQKVNNGGKDILVSKLNNNFSSLITSTYLGGANDDLGYCIALYGNENIYVSGYTASTDFITIPGAYQTISKGGNDIFISKLFQLMPSHLNEDLDNYGLEWTTGGNSIWFDETTITHDGIDAAQSGDINDNEESWVETNVDGPGTLKFWWKISSEPNDILKFYVDGDETFLYSGECDWQQKILKIIGSGTHTLKWTYLKDGITSGGSDKAWLDTIQWLPTDLVKDLDNPYLIWATGGNADWFDDETITHDGVDAARSGDIDDNGESWVQTTVEGPGILKFWWKVSSEINDFLIVYIDGVESLSISGEVEWNQIALKIPGTGTIKWTYLKDGINSGGSDTGWLDTIEWVPTDLAKDLDNPYLNWTTGGNSGWFDDETITHDGVDAARSGDIDDNGESWVQTTVDGPGTISFWWKVSSEQDYDGLVFYVDGVVASIISGEIDWQQVSYDIFGNGTHVLQWYYLKDEMNSSGSDTGWLDQVNWEPSLANSLDNNLTWTTGGNKDWFGQIDDYNHDGTDAAQSGDINDNEWSGIQTTVVGPGTLSFWWRVSSQTDADYFSFYIDGVLTDHISGLELWQQETYILGSGEHTLSWYYQKDGSYSSGADAAYLDQVLWNPPADYNEDLDNSLVWSSDGTTEWIDDYTITHDGTDAARSGYLGDNGASWVVTTVEGPGNISFWWKVSSEPNNDVLVCYLDDYPLGSMISGEVDWQYLSFDITTAGTHTIRWAFLKNESISMGSDAGWLDQVIWTNNLNPTACADPPGGTYDVAQIVSLSMSETGSIYYTLDGSVPTTSSTVYSIPLNITTTTTLNFLAVDSNGYQSPVYTEIYFIKPVKNTRSGIIYDTIQDAIDAAETVDGDTIMVQSGSYTENILVNKVINLQTIGSVMVQALAPNQTVFTINSAGSNSIIQGFNITGVTNAFGIHLSSTNNCQLIDNTISGNYIGIFIQNSHNNNISDSAVQNNAWLGICIDNSSSNTVNNNEISYNVEGIYIVNTANGNTISGNNIHHNSDTGISILNGTTGNLISNNLTISSNGVIGILIRDSNTNTISGNGIGINGWAGIALDNTVGNTINGNNIISGNQEGLNIMNSTGNNISGNSIIGNTNIGVSIIKGSNGNTISSNTNISSNGIIGIYLRDSNTNTISGNNIEGNNWVGICFDNATGNIINSANNISSNLEGLYIVNNSNNNGINNNNIHENQDTGIYIDGSSGNQISDNTAISNNGVIGILFRNVNTNIITLNTIEGNNFAGIALDNAYSNYITGANISGNQMGIYVTNTSNDNTIYSNTIHDNTWAGLVLDNTTNSLVYNNNFNNNPLQALAQNGTENKFYQETVGNYWSDWAITDPRPIYGNEGLYDQHPSTTPIWG